MLVFEFFVEVLSIRPDIEFDNVIIETTKVKVKAENQLDAEDAVLRKFNVFTDFYHRGVSRIDLLSQYKI